jgi:nucleolar pre-ribosomal-associated protein 2
VHRFIHTNIDQPPQKAYISDAFAQIREKVKKARKKKEHRLNYGLIAIFVAAFSVFHTRAAPLNDLGVISKKDLDNTSAAFKDGLLVQLKEILHKSRKEKSSKSKTCQTSQTTINLFILSIMDALAALGVDSSKLSELEDDAKAFCTSVQDTELHIGKRLETFMAIYGPNVISEDLLADDITTVLGRQSIREKTLASTTGKEKQEKLKLLDSIFGPGLVGLTQLDKLQAARQVIVSIEDTRKSKEKEDNKEDDETNTGDEFTLSEAYSILCGNLWKVSGIRQFCIISETLELMLQTKVSHLHSSSNMPNNQP